MRPVAELPYIEWTTKAGDTRRLYADCYVSEEIGLPAVAAKNTVESGARITDHYYAAPETATVEMYFSEAPVRGDLDSDFPGRIDTVSLPTVDYPDNRNIVAQINGAVTGAIGAAFGASGPPAQPTSAQMLVFDQAPVRLPGIAQALRDMRADGTLVTLGNTTVGNLEQMAILDAKVSTSAEDGFGGRLHLELEQIRFANSDIAVAVPIPAEARGQAKKTAGSTTAPVTDANKQSLLNKLAGLLP